MTETSTENGPTQCTLDSRIETSYCQSLARSSTRASCLRFGDWNLFVICFLSFGILRSDYFSEPTVNSSIQAAKRLTLKQLSLLPITNEAIIDEEILDSNRHMNVSWYLNLFSQAIGGMHKWMSVLYVVRDGQASFFTDEIPNRKVQIPNKSQTPMIKTSVTGEAPFVIW